MVTPIKDMTAFSFIFKHKEYEATYSEFKVDCEEWPLGQPQLHVHVKIPKDEYGQAFQFYRTDTDDLFWFKFNDDFKDGMAKVIADTLRETKRRLRTRIKKR